MALDKDALKGRMIKNLKAFGFVSNDHGRMNELAEAFASAVVDEINENGEVEVKGGGSYGGEMAKIL